MARKETGFSPECRALILRRGYGQCERCNKRPTAHLHHRKPRRMGGRYGEGFTDVNRPSNALGLCLYCHQWAETGDRDVAMEHGLILKDGQDSARTPVFLPRYRGWVILDDQGRVSWHPTRAKALESTNDKESNT